MSLTGGKLKGIPRKLYLAFSLNVVSRYIFKYTFWPLNLKQKPSEPIFLFQKWLKVGGKLFISDYCCSAGDNFDHFKKYVKQRGCDLLSLAEYGKVRHLSSACDA